MKAKSKIIKVEIPREFLRYLLVGTAGIVAIALIIAFTKIMLADFLLLFGLILLGAFARLPERFMQIALGVELIGTFTIFAALRYGALTGAIVGVTAFTLSGFFTIERPQDVFIADAGFVIFAYSAAFLANFNVQIGILALAATAIYDLITGTFYMLSGYSIVSILRFSAVHIPANYFLASYLIPILMQV